MKKNKEYPLEIISQAALQFLLPLKEEEIYIALVKQAQSVVKADAGSVYIKRNKNLVKVYCSDPALYVIKKRKNGYIQKVFETDIPFIHSIKILKDAHPDFRNFQYKSFMLIPISYGRESMGVLCLHAKNSRQFKKKDIKSLSLFCALAFLSIRKTQLYTDVKNALDTRDLFISMASHELKTPLTTIQLYADLLQGSFKDKNTRESIWMHHLSKELKRLTLLINELLQVDLIKKGKLTYTWHTCDIESVLTRAVENFKLLYPFHAVYLKNKLSGMPAMVEGDFDKLLQVITNLLHNAAKFSPVNSPITLTLEARPKAITIEVEDKGKGIHQKDLPHVFEQYYKGKNAKQEGMGLGLYIIKSIVESHKGTIAVNSHFQKGTTVTVQLPQTHL